MDCPPGQKNVAVVERWPLVEVRLYFVFPFRKKRTYLVIYLRVKKKIAMP